MSDVPDPTDPAETPPRPAPAAGARWLRRLRLPALVVAGIAAVAAVVGMPLPPVWPFVTGGEIFVESPEVYTRERLVNDRYRQDFWLRSHLDALDASETLIARTEATRLVLGENADAPVSGAAALRETAVAFREDFLLRAAIRDKIRQLVLENLLDDRHDLTGNSIYGLKFDTGIIPGTNTWRRPYVRVTIDLGAAEAGSALDSPRFLLGSLSSREDQQSAFDRTKRQFDGWTASLEGRLRHYIDSRTERSAPGYCARPPGGGDADGAIVDALKADAAGGSLQQAADTVPPPPVAAGFPAGSAARADGRLDVALIKEALQYVMGIDPREVVVDALSLDEIAAGVMVRVALPGAWGQFFDLHIGAAAPAHGAAAAPFLLTLEPFFVTLHFAPLAEWRHFLDNASDPERFRLWHAATIRLPGPVPVGGGEPVEAADWAVLVPASGGAAGARSSTPRPQDLAFVRGLTQDDFARIRGWLPAEPGCVVPGDAIRGGCLLRGLKATIDAPVYRFVKERDRIDAYSYAVFPRGDVEGILSEHIAAVETPGFEFLGLTVGAEAERRVTEARADPTVVNFSDDAAEDGQVQFGWSVVQTGRQRPRQVSQMVLVSVPAYLERLDLGVETGWLDRESRPIATSERARTMSVSLPTDYEALDSLVAGRSRRDGPAIDQSHFDPRYCGRPVEVRACAPADILIPGARLWRSTTVTLGGQQADQITVTPDMQGIVASFRPVQIPPSGAEGGERVVEPLLVWTSEGSDQVRGGAAVLMPGGAACPP